MNAISHEIHNYCVHTSMNIRNDKIYTVLHYLTGKGRNFVTVSEYMSYRWKNVDTLTSSQTLILPLQIQTKKPKPRPILLV